MKTITKLAFIIGLGLIACKKKDGLTPQTVKPTINYYDTVNTGKSFIETYITNTDGNTKVYLNNDLLLNDNGSSVKVFNAYVNDTVKIVCEKQNIGYIQIDIRKNYTYVQRIDTNSLQLTTIYIVK